MASASLESQEKSAAIVTLTLLFPTIDQGYLNQIIDYHQHQQRYRPQQFPRHDLVQSVSDKLLDANHGHYPTVVFAASAPTSNGAHKDVESKIREEKRVQSTWNRAKASTGRGSSNSSRAPLSIQPRTEVDVTMTKNQALIRLNSVFPTTPPRSIKVSLASSHLYDAVDILISTPSQQHHTRLDRSWFANWFKPTKSKQDEHQSKIYTLEPHDLFHSDSYGPALYRHLTRLHPNVPAWVIRARIATNGLRYADVRKDLSNYEASQTKASKWFSGLLKSHSTSTSKSHVQVEQEGIEEDEEEEQELRREIWEYEAPARHARTAADDQYAREFNTAMVLDDDGLLTTCECCYSELAIDEFGFCSSGVHSFCRECINSQVKEHVYGGAPLTFGQDEVSCGEGGHGTGVQCFSTDGCESSFSLIELKRTLSPSLMLALDARLRVFAVDTMLRCGERNGERIVRCPFCSYAEFADDRILARAFPLFRTGTPSTSLAASSLSRLLVSLMGMFLALVVFAVLYLLAIIYAFLLPDSFLALVRSASSVSPTISTSELSSSTSETVFLPLLEPIRLLQLVTQYFRICGRRTIDRSEGTTSIFTCRNGISTTSRYDGVEYDTTREQLVDRLSNVDHAAIRGRGGSSSAGRDMSNDGNCGRQSCLICGRDYTPIHQCYAQEREGKRLAIEKAMSDSTKRVCLRCDVAYIKSEGCNRIVCRCGFEMCFVCRQGISGYSHFCQHLRLIPGSDCPEPCGKCELYKVVDDDTAARRAADQARLEWDRDHSTDIRMQPERFGRVLDQNEHMDRLERMFEKVVMYILAGVL